MPVICRFYGLIIKMFFVDHNPPHFHVIYNEYNALVDISSLKILEGDLPKRAEKMALEWAKIHQKKLIEIWNTKNFTKLPPLK